MKGKSNNYYIRRLLHQKYCKVPGNNSISVPLHHKLAAKGQYSSGLDRQQNWRQQSILPSFSAPCTALIQCVNSLSNILTIRMRRHWRGQVGIWIYKGHTAGRKMRHSGRHRTSGELWAAIRYSLCRTGLGISAGNLKPKGIKKNITALGKATWLQQGCFSQTYSL